MIEHGKETESERITRCVLGQVADLSCQKYSSNVIEKIICCATDGIRGEIVKEIASSSRLRELLHDKVGIRYGCNVVCELCNSESSEAEQ